MGPWPYVPAALALVVCLACRRHVVLLWLGVLVLLVAGGVAWYAYGTLRGVRQPTGEHHYVAGLLVYLAASVAAAGLVLVVGGLVRWRRTRQTRDARRSARSRCR